LIFKDKVNFFYEDLNQRTTIAMSTILSNLGHFLPKEKGKSFYVKPKESFEKVTK